MHLLLRDPSHTQRLATFLQSVGQDAVVAGPRQLELVDDTAEAFRLELEIYLRVWRVLHPEAGVELAA